MPAVLLLGFGNECSEVLWMFKRDCHSMFVSTHLLAALHIAF
jgi:hypothetical protein